MTAKERLDKQLRLLRYQQEQQQEKPLLEPIYIELPCRCNKWPFAHYHGDNHASR